MVLRAILRNIQNTLVLASVLLVVLAFQRLQHYEFPHQLGSQSFIDEGGASSRNLDEAIVRVGSHHQVILGREFRIGLFRFFLPRLERTQDDNEGQQEALLARPKQAEWEASAASSSPIQYIIDLSGNETMNVICHLLDAATVLYESIMEEQEKKQVSFHALVSSSMHQSASNCNATSTLTRLGYRVVDISTISLKGCSELWQAYAIQTITTQAVGSTSVVVHLPPTAVAKHQHSKEPINRRRSVRTRARVLSSSVYSSSQAIQILRFNSGSNNNNDCTNLAPTICHASPCQISKSVSLVVPPRKCPMPWEFCADNRTASSSSCRSYHRLWQQRHGKDVDVMCQNGTHTLMVSVHGASEIK